MPSTTTLRRRGVRRISKKENSLRHLGPHLRPLRLEHLEARRMLTNGPFYDMATDLSQQLTTYQGAVDGILSGASSVLSSLPIVGSQLGGIIAVQSAIDGAATSIQGKLQAIGQGGGQSDFVNALYAALGPSGTNILASSNINTPNSQSQPSDIHVTTPFTFDGTTFVSGAVEMRLHETIVSPNVNLTTGLSTLPIQFQTAANVAILGNIDLELAIRYDTNNSPVLSLPPVSLNDFTSGSPNFGVNPMGNGSQLMFSVSASVSGSLTAYVGFLQGRVTATGSPSQNQLSANVYVSSLRSPAVSFGGSAYLNLNAQLSIANDPQFPSIGTTLTMMWTNLSDPSTLNFSFGNLTLDLGSFFSQEIAPILSDIKQYTEPIEDVVNVLTKPIPGIDSLPGMSHYDLVDAVEQFDPSTGSELASMVSFVSDLTSLLGTVPSIGAGGSIDFGNFSLAGTNLTGPNAVPSAVTNLANTVAGSGVLSSLTTGDLDGASSGLLSSIENNPDWLQQNDQNLGPGQSVAGTLGSDASIVGFPVLDDPSSLLGMLFGQDVNLITVNLPINIANFNFGVVPPVFIPILGPLGINVSFSANFGANGELELGYDTEGLREALADPNPANILNDVADGLYIQGPNGSDPGTSLNLSAGISASAGPGISVGFASASIGLSGGLAADLDVTMNPGIEGPGGKIRLSSLTSNLGNDFAASGSITANLAIAVNVQFLTYSTSITVVPLDNLTLWNSNSANATNAPGQQQPAPSIYGLGATDGPVGGGNQITIYGTNLENASSVTFDELNANTAYGQYAPVSVTPFNITPTSLDVDVPADTAADGYPYLTAFARVTTPGGTTPDLFSQPYTFYPPPSVAGIGPSTGLGGGGTLVEFSGSGLEHVTVVDFGGTPGIILPQTYNISSDSTIFVYAPAGTGTVPLTVTSDGGTCSAGTFTYVPQPQVTGVSPSVGPANVNTSAAEIVTISGENFGDYDNATGQYVSTVNEVTFNNAEAGSSPPDPVLSNTYYPAEYDLEHVLIVPAHWEITVNAPFCSATNTYDVRVETSPIGDLPPLPRPSGDNLGNWSPITAADQFTYLAPPSITAVSPAGGPTRGGATVTIDGTNFSDAAAVDFGNIPATSFTVDSETQITATSPAGPASKVDVTVTTPGGISVPPVNVFVDPDAFTFVTPPVFYAMSPVQSWGAWGPLSGGTKITITGKYLASVTAVDFGSVAGTNLSINSAGTQLTVDSPAESAGAVEVNLVSLGATGGSLDTGEKFYYEGVPAVTGISPNTLDAAGNTEATITGTGLYPASAVHFIGTQDPLFNTAALSITNESPTQLVVVAPAGVHWRNITWL